MSTRQHGWAVGLDMGGTKCLGILLDPDNVVRATHRSPTPVGTEAVLNTLIETAETLRSACPVAIESVGCGVPGLVTAAGELRFAPHLAGVTDLPLRTLLGERLGVRTVVENDNTCAAAAEADARPTVGSLLYVGFGTGIGGGLVLDGALCRGHNGFAGEFGHLVVVVDGEPCVCGRRGCWERYASGDALGRLGSAAGIEGGGVAVREGLRNGDPVARGVVDHFGRLVALGLVNLVFSFDPEMIVLGGGAMGERTDAEELLEPIRRAVITEFGNAARHRTIPPIDGSSFGPIGAAVGAALLSRADHPEYNTRHEGLGR